MAFLFGNHRASSAFFRLLGSCCFFFFFQAEDGIRDLIVTGVQTCALPICSHTSIQPGTTGALPPSLPEWKYVNTGNPFWAVRHFDKGQASADPTSPFGGKDRKSVV